MGRPSRSGARSGHRHARAGSFGRLLTRGTVAPRRRGETAGGPIGRAHVVLPGQPVTACQEIPHIRIGTVPGAAGDRGEPAMAELVDVVLYSPGDARLADEIGAPLRRE